MKADQSQNVTVSQARDYLQGFLLKHSDGVTPADDPRNDRLLLAISTIDDEHEGLITEKENT